MPAAKRKAVAAIVAAVAVLAASGAACTSFPSNTATSPDGGGDGGGSEAASGPDGGLDATKQDAGEPDSQGGHDTGVGGETSTGDAGHQPDSGACEAGTKACTADGDGGTSPETCGMNDQWVVGAPCPYVCTAGSCSGTCLPGALQCNGNQPQKCDATGTWQNMGTPCPNVCTAGMCAGSCVPGTLQCSNLQPEKCAPNGTWANNGNPCQYVCSQGNCTGVCTPGATNPVSCGNCGTDLQTCSASGTWQDGTCSGQGACAPNATQPCDTNGSQTCTSSCTWGTCTCNTGYTLCGSTCVNTTNDPNNCGACGRSCMNGACSASVCQPWVVTTTTSVAVVNGGQFATDGTWVALDTGNVSQIKATGVGGTISSGGAVLNQNGTGPVMANGTVAWLNGGTTTSIFSAADGATSSSAKANWPTGYTPSYIALNSSATNAFVIGAQIASPWKIYLYDCTLTGTGCGPLNNGNAIETPGNSTSTANYLQVSPNYAYWAFYGSSGDFVRSLNFGTNQITSVQSTSAANITLDANNVYWWANPGVTVYRAAQSAITSPSAVTTVGYRPFGLASDGKYVYIATGNANGQAVVYYAPAGGNGATATVLFTSAANPSAEGPIFAAGGAVYWADVDNSQSTPVATIRGVAAPP